jgi:hypothetical protein
MSAVPRPARPGSLTGDDAVRRYVEAIRRDIEPDPMFRRRLRGTVVNRFVAQREGVVLVLPSPLGRRTGTLGRACLYASFALAMSVGGVMAASESAIPGDLLYPLKRSIEEMRMEVAPAHLRDDLAAYALGERVDELSRLVERGALVRAATFAATVEASYEELVATAGDDALASERLEAQVAHLDEVLDQAPERAREAIVNAMSGAPGLQPTHAGQAGADGGQGSQSQGDGNGTSKTSGGSNGNKASDENGGSTGNGPSGAGAPGEADQTPGPAPTPEPASDAEASERPDRTPNPARTPRSAPTPEPTPGVEADQP